MSYVNDGFDLESLRLHKRGSRFRQAGPRTTPRNRRFLRGPIDLNWLEVAAKLPGKALAVGLVVWLLVGLKKTDTVTVTRTALSLLNVGRKGGYNGLEALESAGLIRVDRHRGRCPVATVLDHSKPDESSLDGRHRRDIDNEQ